MNKFIIVVYTTLLVCSRSTVATEKKESHDIKRIVKIVPFHVVGIGPLPPHCPDDTDFISDESFSMCLDKFKAHDMSAPRSKIDGTLVTVYNRYCPPFLKKNEQCIFSINKKEATPDRFRTMGTLPCQAEDAIFTGVYFCKEKSGRPVGDGEVVTLVAKRGQSIDAKCPEGKKINVLSAFHFGSLIHDGGLLNSIDKAAVAKCEGLSSCSFLSSQEGKEFNYLTYESLTYKCV